jgi:hypothetical protein
VLHVVHVVRSIGGLLLSKKGAGRQQAGKQEIFAWSYPASSLDRPFSSYPHPGYRGVLGQNQVALMDFPVKR